MSCTAHVPCTVESLSSQPSLIRTTSGSLVSKVATPKRQTAIYCSVGPNSQLHDAKIPACNVHTHTELHSEGRFSRVVADQKLQETFYSVIQISGAGHVQWRDN